MAYYQYNTDCTEVICDDCGDLRWETNPKYGTNTDARLAEREATGVQWNWTNSYSQDKHSCSLCGNTAY